MPLVAYDKNERTYNPPMPLLFQWPCRLEDRPVSETSLRGYHRRHQPRRPRPAIHLP